MNNFQRPTTNFQTDGRYWELGIGSWELSEAMTAPTEDRRRISARVGVLQGGVIVCFAALAICFWVLQVVQTDKFVEMANSNYQRTLPLRAPRGVLYDRNGRVLVENRESFTISIDRESAKHLTETARTVSDLLGLDREQVLQIVERHVSRKEPVYRPIVIVQDATLEQVMRIRSRQRELPEILIEQVPDAAVSKRGAGRASLRLCRTGGREATRRWHHAGIDCRPAGIELSYNKVLMGRDGVKRVVVNSVGREIRRAARENSSDRRETGCS
jgi:penicillin-binding protein 2